VLRRTVELLSRNVVLRRRLPTEFGGGRMYISPAARLKYWKPNIYVQERFLFDIARLLIQPGDVVWDAGANNGVFSVAAAGVAGPQGEVLAFEADTWLANLIRRTALILPSSYAPIDVLNVAVCDQLGLAEFAIAARSRAANFLVQAGGSSQSGGIRNTYRVLTIGLDTMLDLAPAPRVIKIDIEGAELMAFRGATKLLNQIRPRIVCEVDEKNAEPLAQQFTAANYLMFDAEHLEQHPQRISLPTLNTLFLPADDPLVPQIEKA
jgi:FkbM family methyltransferase